MKPLLQGKITPARKSVGDWIPAADQSTDAGRNEFWRRQQERMKAAQAKPQTFTVIDLKRKP